MWKKIVLLLLSFNVNAFTITPSMTGSWFDDKNPGQGINIEVLPDKRFLVYWYAFDQTHPLWLAGVGTYSGDTVTIQKMETFRGSQFGVNHDKNRVERSDFGQLAITFTNCTSGTMTYNSIAGFGNGTINLTRLTNIPDLLCADPPAYHQRVITRNGIRVEPGECNLLGTSLTCEFKVTSLENDIDLSFDLFGAGNDRTDFFIGDKRFSGDGFTLGSAINHGSNAKETIGKGETVRGSVTFTEDSQRLPRSAQGADFLHLIFQIPGKESFNMEWTDIVFINHNL